MTEKGVTIIFGGGVFFTCHSFGHPYLLPLMDFLVDGINATEFSFCVGCQAVLISVIVRSSFAPFLIGAADEAIR
jgi:hypothetical protein